MNKEELADMSPAQLKKIRAALEAEKDEHVDFPITRPDGRGNPKPVGCVENTKALLTHNGVSVRYNEMTKAIEIAMSRKVHKDRALNESLVIVRDLARKAGYDASITEETLIPISGENAYHPARDWILSRPWDGNSRVNDLLDTVACEEEDEYKRMIITKWLIGAVALLMYDSPHQNLDHEREGFKGVEGILVFKGRQGLGKTQWIERLVPPRTGWAKDAVTLDPHNKDSVMLAVSHWIVELGEVDATFKKADIAALKGFATAKQDILRPPYGKTADTYRRRTAFTGTVNDTTFLAESGENRRWWVLAVDSVDSNHGIDTQQLWAEMYHQYMQCTPYWLTVRERQIVYRANEKYEQIDPLTEKLKMYVRAPVQSQSGDSGANYTSLGSGQIVELLFKRPGNKREANDVSTWLLRQGFHREANTKKFRVNIDVAAMKRDQNRMFDIHFKTQEPLIIDR